jgi:hypothetical protein
MKARSLMKRWRHDVNPYFFDLDGHLVRVLAKLNNIHTQCQTRRIDFEDVEREIKGIMNHASAISDEAASLRVSLDILHKELFGDGLPRWEDPEVVEIAEIIPVIPVIQQEPRPNGSQVINVDED